MHWHYSSSGKASFSKPIASAFRPAPIIDFSYGAEVCLRLVQLIGRVSALIRYIEMQVFDHTRIFDFFLELTWKTKVRFREYFYKWLIHENWSLNDLKVLEKF